MALDGLALRVIFTFCCGISYLLYGYDQGFMSGVLLADDWLVQMDQPSTFMQGLITSIYELGCLAGCVVSFVFSERFGRKKPLLIGTTFVIVGAVLQTTAYGQAQFIIGRIIAGVGTGLNTSIIPIWQAETLPAKTRELFGSFQYLLVCFGASVSYWMNYGLSYAGGAFEWRFAVAAQIVFALILICIVPFMPESPRWLMAHNQPGASLDVLLRMHGVTDQSDEEVQTEVRLINQAIELESAANSLGWLELFKNHPETQNFRRVMLGWWLMAMVMLSGVCSIGYYISYLFETSVGLSHNLSLLLSGFNGLWYMFSALIPPYIISRIGKRGCLMVGAFGMGVCFLAMALGIRSGGYAASIVTVIAFFLYYTFFAIGYLAVPWLYCAEIMPLHLRSKGNAFTTSSNWVWNFATVMMTPSTMSSQGWKGYLIFTVFNFSFIPFIYFFYPETSGRRLEEIDAIFYKTGPIVSGTQWAKRGRFEADMLETVLDSEKHTAKAEQIENA
ncbi:sugar transporter [Xylariales sp. PMI_506]|nr:sugar transporter [Xylariales sp. PMI_506]